MPAAGPDSLATLQETLRQIRAIPQVRELRPGTYQLLGRPFIQFREEGGKLTAELGRTSGTGIDRLAVDTAPEQRKLVDEAKRRAVKMVDDS